MKSLVAGFIVLFGHVAWSANHYVRAGATGNGSGSDWTNAYTALPSTLTRGDTYYVADGSYPAYLFDDAPSGTAIITVKKCSASDHGVDTGYSSAYCDGQAVFSSMSFRQPYFVVDGAYRSESNWKNNSAYGFSVDSLRSSRFDFGDSQCTADNLTFKYLHIGRATTSFETRNGEGLYLGGFGSGAVACEQWTLHRSLVQNTVVGIQCAGCKGLTVEYSYFYVGWGKEAIRGQVAASDMTVRHSIFEDSCQRDRNDPTSGCTAEIALWDGDTTGVFDNNRIYGNVFFKTTAENNSGGTIVIGGDGSSWVGVSASGTKVYNNTFAGLKQGQVGVRINGGSSNECRNNLWYDTSVYSGCSGTAVASNNLTVTANIFASYSTGNFRLSAPTATGFTLASPFNVDLDGNVRGANGTWDIGAFEHGGAPAVSPLRAPTGLRFLN